ncbi:Endonuclease-reverse transcriptase [Popillia japonica]|uniref:Endonuclease-reverse transcriptase n=1 Tax=Popillia japonica TaxID=7064 RepID=A0AAW1HRK5_POPJA
MNRFRRVVMTLVAMTLSVSSEELSQPVKLDNTISQGTITKPKRVQHNSKFMDSFSVAINNKFGVLADINMDVDETPVQDQPTTSGASENLKQQAAEKCKRCQSWGHPPQNYYLGVERCVKCAQNHLSYQCGKSITLLAKCANCGEDHPASSTQCKVYQNEIQKLQASRQRVSVSREPRASARESRYVPALPPPVNAWNGKNIFHRYSLRKQEQHRRIGHRVSQNRVHKLIMRVSRRGMSQGVRDARLRGRAFSSFSQPQQGLPTNSRSNPWVSLQGTRNKHQSDLNEIVNTMNEINAIVDLNKLSQNLKKLLQVIKNAVPHLNMPWQFTNLTSIIKFVLWNCNGISGKITEVRELLQMQGIHILLLAETRLPNNYIFQLPAYSVVEKHGPVGHGGVAIANSPAKKLDTAQLEGFLKISRKVVVAGDFNATHANWGCRRNNANENTLNAIITNRDALLYCPLEPTHIPANSTIPSTVDLVFATNVKDIGNMDAETTSSDHAAVIFDLGERAAVDGNRTINDYSKANWLFRKIMHNIDTVEELDKIVETFTNNITCAIEKAIPQKTINPYKFNELPPKIVTHIAERNRHRRLYQRRRDPLYNQQMKECTRII